jgi:response regulator RpfG family c-di-GMP phosphodiesterase
MAETILFVDDDIRVVSALQRSLYKNYRVEIAGSATDGLDAIRESTYAVVVSDLRMPGMNGIDFLIKVKEMSPDTVRILLTGQAELEMAIAAVNEGAIFRFLTKPCPQELLTKTLDAALRQFLLVTAEHDLLRETLMGTVAVLIEVLSAVQPMAFGRVPRLRRCARALAGELKVQDSWQIEAAAMLSQIGCIAVKPEVLQKHYAGKDLSDEEKSQIQRHPQVGRNLLRLVPRLHAVSLMVERQQDDFVEIPDLDADRYTVALGSQTLRVALDYDRLAGMGMSQEAVVLKMHRNASQYNPVVLSALADLIQNRQLVADYDATAHEQGAAPGEQQIFRPLAEQVLRALRG